MLQIDLSETNQILFLQTRCSHWWKTVLCVDYDSG